MKTIRIMTCFIRKERVMKIYPLFNAFHTDLKYCRKARQFWIMRNIMLNEIEEINLKNKKLNINKVNIDL